MDEAKPIGTLDRTGDQGEPPRELNAGTSGRKLYSAVPNRGWGVTKCCAHTGPDADEIHKWGSTSCCRQYYSDEELAAHRAAEIQGRAMAREKHRLEQLDRGSFMHPPLPMMHAKVDNSGPPSRDMVYFARRLLECKWWQFKRRRELLQKLSEC